MCTWVEPFTLWFHAQFFFQPQREGILRQKEEHPSHRRTRPPHHDVCEGGTVSLHFSGHIELIHVRTYGRQCKHCSTTISTVVLVVVLTIHHSRLSDDLERLDVVERELRSDEQRRAQRPFILFGHQKLHLSDKNKKTKTDGSMNE